MVLSGFWQLARHWKEGNVDKLELACKDRNRQIKLLASLGNPDKSHVPDNFFLTFSEEDSFSTIFNRRKLCQRSSLQIIIVLGN